MPLPLRERLKVDVVDRSAERGWKRHRASIYEIESYTNSPEWLGQYRQVFRGAGLTVMDTKTRYINVAGWPVTDGELARGYLRAMKEHYGEQLPYQRGVVKAGLMKRTAPLYCKPTRAFRALSYIDLHHAYWSILRAWPWDSIAIKLDGKEKIITPLGGLRWLWPDELDADRGLRFATVGVLFSLGIEFWRYGKFTQHPDVPGTFTQPTLHYILHATMHAIARDVIKHFPTHAWLTDACIVDRAAEDDVRAYLAERWRMASSVKGRGMGRVHNITSYRIGGDPGFDIPWEIKRWTEDQDARNDRHPYAELDKIDRVNVAYWRRLREESLARDQG